MNTKFIKFDEYCPKCRYEKEPETSDPCNQCLMIPAKEGTRKPDRYWPKTGVNKDKKGSEINE